jgi:glycosyltransferase involved in cell wall biosynthesis
MKLSVIMPVYNEEVTIAEIIGRVRATKLVSELIVVDDGSTDNSPAILELLEKSGQPPLLIVRHEQNLGKGAAIRTGLSLVTGDLALVQDADLEYDPADYSRLLEPFKNPAVQVVYGSRNLHNNPRSYLSFYWGGLFLVWFTNLLYDSRITDEATGFKVFKTDLLKNLSLKGNGFEFCPEVTGKLLRRKIAIHDVPISYSPRSWSEGKKIRWYDGVFAILCLLKYRFYRQ